MTLNESVGRFNVRKTLRFEMKFRMMFDNRSGGMGWTKEDFKYSAHPEKTG